MHQIIEKKKTADTVTPFEFQSHCGDSIKLITSSESFFRKTLNKLFLEQSDYFAEYLQMTACNQAVLSPVLRIQIYRESEYQ